jgi:hypothetical protein
MAIDQNQVSELPLKLAQTSSGEPFWYGANRIMRINSEEFGEANSYNDEPYGIQCSRRLNLKAGYLQAYSGWAKLAKAGNKIIITKVRYRTLENNYGIRFWMSWVTVVTKELMEDMAGYDEAFEDLSETCKNEQMWWKPLVRTMTTPPFIVRDIIVDKFDQFIKREKSLLFHRSIKTYESKLHMSVVFNWEKLKINEEPLRQEWIIPRYKVWLACIGNTALWLDEDHAEVSRPWDRPEGTFYERLGERFHLMTVDEAGDYACHVERGVTKGVEGELEDSPEKEFWRVEQVKFESLGTRFYRQYILSKREDGLHIETMLKLIVDGTIRTVPPYLVKESEEWTIHWPVLRKEHVWELFSFYEKFDDECWEYPKIIWNPRGISRKWDDTENVQYDQIKTWIGTKLLKRSLKPTPIR